MLIRYSAAWLAQQPYGIKVGNLEQLLGSTDIRTTLFTWYSLRSTKAIAGALFLVWVVGTVSDQAILRVLSTGYEQSNSTVSFYYFDTSTARVQSIFSPPDQISIESMAARTVFQAGLLSATRSLNASSDGWGNVKIPMLETLDKTLADSDGWIHVPNENVSYTSMIGSPIAGILPWGNSTFSITTAYFYANCSDPIKYTDLNAEFMWPQQNATTCAASSSPVLLGGSRFNNNTILGTCSIGSLMYNQWNQIGTSSSQLRSLLFQSQTSAGVSAFNCTVQYITAESDVQCNGPDCFVTRIRPAPASPPSWISPLENCTTAQNFYNQFTAACQPFLTYLPNSPAERPVSSILEIYLMFNGAKSGTFQVEVDLSTIPGAVLSDRFTRVLNTFWTASIAPDFVPGTMSSFNFQSNSVLVSDYPGIQDSADVAQANLVYVRNWVWPALLLISSVGFTLIVLRAIILKYRAPVPEVFAKTSSVIWAAPRLELRDVGITSDTTVVPRPMRNRRVRLQDAKPGQPIGHLALLAVDKDPDCLTKQRKYTT